MWPWTPKVSILREALCRGTEDDAPRVDAPGEISMDMEFEWRAQLYVFSPGFILPAL